MGRVRAAQKTAFRLAGALTALLLAAAPVAATSLLPTGNTRHVVRALAGTNDGGVIVETEPTIDTPVTASFDDRVDARQSIPGAAATGHAEMRTTLGATRVEGEASVGTAASATGRLLSAGLGEALFRFEFEVAAPVAYHLDITLESDDPLPFVEVSFFEGSFGTRFALDADGRETFTHTGTLMPGTFYFLSAIALVSADAGGIDAPADLSRSGHFAFALTVPEPAGLCIGLVALVAFEGRRALRRHRPALRGGLTRARSDPSHPACSPS